MSLSDLVPQNAIPKTYTVFRRNEANFEAAVNNYRSYTNRHMDPDAAAVNNFFSGNECVVQQFTRKRDAVQFARSLNEQCKMLENMGVAFKGRYTFNVYATVWNNGKANNIPVLMKDEYEDAEYENEDDPDKLDPEYLRGVQDGLGTMVISSSKEKDE